MFCFIGTLNGRKETHVGNVSNGIVKKVHYHMIKSIQIIYLTQQRRSVAIVYWKMATFATDDEDDGRNLWT